MDGSKPDAVSTVQGGPNGVVTSGLILWLDTAYLRSYPGYDNTWYDLSATSNNGTLVNGPTYSSANGGAIVFDGTNDYVSLTANPSLTNRITLEAWVNLSSPPTKTFGWISGREQSYRLLYATSLFSWVCSTTNNSWYTTGTEVNALDIPATGSAYQVIGTYDGQNNKIYINGQLNNTGSTISGNIASTAAAYHLFRTGASNIDYGKGNLYCNRVYNRALSASEVLQNYNATKTRFGL